MITKVFSKKRSKTGIESREETIEGNGERTALVATFVFLLLYLKERDGERTTFNTLNNAHSHSQLKRIKSPLDATGVEKRSKVVVVVWRRRWRMYEYKGIRSKKEGEAPKLRPSQESKKRWLTYTHTHSPNVKTPPRGG